MASSPSRKSDRPGLAGAGESLLGQAGGLFKALGDSSRLRLLQVLLDAGEPLSQGELAQAAGLTVSNASKHLTLLVREGLVRRRPSGNQAHFDVDSPVVADVCDMICGHVSRRAQANLKSLR